MNIDTKNEEFYENKYYRDHRKRAKWPLLMGYIILICMFIVTYIFSSELNNSIMLIILGLFIFIIFPLIIGFGFYIESILIPMNIHISKNGITIENKYGKKNKFYRWVDITKIERKETSIGKGKTVKALKFHFVSGKVTISQYLYPDIADIIYNKYNEVKAGEI